MNEYLFIYLLSINQSFLRISFLLYFFLLAGSSITVIGWDVMREPNHDDDVEGS